MRRKPPGQARKAAAALQAALRLKAGLGSLGPADDAAPAAADAADATLEAVAELDDLFADADGGGNGDGAADAAALSELGVELGVGEDDAAAGEDSDEGMPPPPPSDTPPASPVAARRRAASESPQPPPPAEDAGGAADGASADVHARPLKHWGTARVARWLVEAVKLPQYAHGFRSEGVDGALVLELDDEMLTDLGVDDTAHRRQILSALYGPALSTGGLRDASNTSPSAPAAPAPPPAPAPAPAHQPLGRGLSEVDEMDDDDLLASLGL